MTINAETIYPTDNGAAYCGDHLGATAKATGRDISGQPILPLTPDMMNEPGVDAIRCEHPRCGRKPSRVWTA